MNLKHFSRFFYLAFVGFDSDGKSPIDESGLLGFSGGKFGGDKAPPVDFTQPGVHIFADNDNKQSTNNPNKCIFVFN